MEVPGDDDTDNSRRALGASFKAPIKYSVTPFAFSPLPKV